MKRTIRSLISILTCALFASTATAQDAEQEFRKFTDSSGREVEAILIDKTDTEVALKLKNGANATFPIDKLSPEDQEFIKGWSKEKDLFLRKCLSLSVRELLELRGYESFDFRFESNHIIIDGEINGHKAKLLIDTGAGGSTLHLGSAEKFGCEIGPMDQIVYGIGGQAPAAITKVSTIKLGESIITNQTMLSCDMYKDQPAGAHKNHDGLFGAKLLRQLDAVIDYKEYRMFLKPGLADGSAEAEPEKASEFRLFKTADGKSYRGNIKSKTTSAVTIEFTNGKSQQFSISGFSQEDRDFISKWSETRDIFMRKCGSLTVQDLLQLREYKSFQYEYQGTHIFVDGKLKETPTRFMIDTGAGTSLMNKDDATKAGLSVGAMIHKIHGVGGVAMAGATPVPSLSIGDVLVANRTILATDLFKQMGGKGDYAAIFGADFLRELNGVITYRENRIFLKP